MRLRPTCVPLMAMVLFFTLVNAVAPVVDVSHSKYRGNDLGNGVTHWLGIRYAAPPLGDLRFIPPQDPVRNRQTKNANKVIQAQMRFPERKSSIHWKVTV
ncbi:cholinesterase precursor [Fusarium fujikuroi]|nr:cholinesterase precursor [Fusarium fujikuroi]